MLNKMQEIHDNLKNMKNCLISDKLTMQVRFKDLDDFIFNNGLEYTNIILDYEIEDQGHDMDFEECDLLVYETNSYKFFALTSY